MESPSVDICLNGGMGVSSRSPSWPTPPVAHSHPHLSSASIISTTVSNNNNNNNNSIINNNTHFLGFSPTSSPSSAGPSLHQQDHSNSAVGTSDDGNNTANSFFSNNNNNNTNNNNKVDISQNNEKTKPSNSQHSQNTVGRFMLHGEGIVSLMIDNKERLCLAQISNTLLKDYSYNEIHNRRVALGITCVQCTPVQLEILRRAGAMPVSSRRCGMITKREAERLVKSFLEENTPPKLPEDFAFDVFHECGWGCRGLFEPSRYNSSRAKCIKCTYCNMYFSPNKFIFHFHRTPESKYSHPDAANFNSWRRHLRIYSGNDNEEIVYKWEDVKAMFNGGTRKRLFSSASASLTKTSSSSTSSMSSSSTHISASQVSRSISHSDSSVAKKIKPNPIMDTPNSYLHKAPAFPNPFNPYSWLAGAPSKSPYPFLAMNHSQPMCFGFPGQTSAKDLVSERMKAPNLTPPSWMTRSASAAGPFPLSSMDLFWGDKAFSFPPAAAAMGFRGTGYPPPSIHGATHPGLSTGIMDSQDHLSPRSEDASCHPSPQGSPQNMIKSSLERDEKGISAFKRVVPSSSSPCSSLSPQTCAGEDCQSPCADKCRDEEEEDQDLDTDSVKDLSTHALKDNEDLEIDVEEDLEDKKKRTPELGELLPETNNDLNSAGTEDSDRRGKSDPPSTPCTEIDAEMTCGTRESQSNYQYSQDKQQESSSMSSPLQSPTSNEYVNRPSPSCKNITVSEEASKTNSDSRETFGDMSKEELCQTLKSEVESRRRREKEVTVLKDTFREEVNREKNFREHMSQQLEMLRETLTSELEQERKIRFSLQQRLKEAHDALQNFSCSLLNARREGFPLKDSALLPR